MSAFLSEYNVAPTVSGQSIGSIDVINVSGGTGPYSVSWSGDSRYDSNGYTSTQWDLHNLGEGVYQATITDTNSNEGITLVYLSAYTNPSFSALVTSYSCVTNPNLSCEITIYSAGTLNLFSQYTASTFNYSLYRDGSLFRTKTIATADTQTSQTFKNLTNGEYMLTIGREQSLTRKFKITDAQCTASSISISATSNPAYRLSAMTSAHTINSHFAGGNYYVGTVPSNYTTGLYNWGHILDGVGHWFFTGNSDNGGTMDYPNINPNTARTTDTTRYWYLGVSGASDCQEGWNCSPSGVVGGDPVVAASQKDLTGTTIAGSAFRGTYYYHRYLNKFFVYDTTTGTTTNDYAWLTYNPLADRDSKGDPVSSEIITQHPAAFKFGMLAHVGDTNIFPYIGDSNVVTDYKSYASKLENNYCSTTIKRSVQSGDTRPATFISPCGYLDYTHDVYLFQSGASTTCSASIVLAYFRDNSGTYGESGATHYLTLDFETTSGATVSFNKGQSARAFQRDVFGQTVIQGNPEDSDDAVVQALVVEAQQRAVNQFIDEYPDVAASMGFGHDEAGPVDSGHSDSHIDYDHWHEAFSEVVGYAEMYERILIALLSEYEATLDPGEDTYLTTQYKEFDTTVLRNGPFGGVSPSGAHRSPYAGGAMTVQGAIKVRITRSGSEGQYFRIQMTPTMGEQSNAYAAEATVDMGDENLFQTYHEINFDLTDSTTWSGSTQSAPTWTTGTELQRFLGGTRYGWMAGEYFSIFYGGGFTGTSANYSVESTNPTFISSSSAITLTETTIYNPDLSLESQTLGDVVGNNNIQFSKNCDYRPRCGSELTVPDIRPRASATLQTFREPIVVLEGLSKSNTTLPNLKIINLSGYSGNTPVITANTSGNTSELLLKKSYLKLNLYGYDYTQSKLNLKPAYSYIFNTLSELSNEQDRKQGISLSSTTTLPLSGLPTGNTWEYIIKPSFIIKDKSTKDPVWVDTTDNTGGVKITNKDYYMCLVQTPREPGIRNTDIGFKVASGSGNLRIATKNETVTGVPDFDGTQSAFTYSALTLPYPPQSNVQVVVNGITMKQSASLTTEDWKTTESVFGTYVSGDYFWSGIRLVMAPRTVKNGDIVQVLYPATSNKSYYNQTLTVGTVDNSETSVMYKDTANYYINLDYEPFGGLQLILNGQTLTEGVDFQKVTSSRIQFLTYVVGGTTDFISSDVISMYYLTQYDVVGLASTKEPNINVSIDKKLYLIEDVKLVVFDSNGDIVQKLMKTYNSNDSGRMTTLFQISVPSPGTYSYNLQTRRYYPLLNGSTITTENNTKNITFIIDKTTFYSPYIKNRGNSGIKPSRGGY